MRKKSERNLLLIYSARANGTWSSYLTFVMDSNIEVNNSFSLEPLIRLLAFSLEELEAEEAGAETVVVGAEEEAGASE